VQKALPAAAKHAGTSVVDFYRFLCYCYIRIYKGEIRISDDSKYTKLLKHTFFPEYKRHLEKTLLRAGVLRVLGECFYFSKSEVNIWLHKRAAACVSVVRAGQDRPGYLTYKIECGKKWIQEREGYAWNIRRSKVVLRHDGNGLTDCNPWRKACKTGWKIRVFGRKN
jgi:hypothetical protein